MRIAIAGDLSTTPSSYGGQTRQLLTHLERIGHDVANFALQHSGPPERRGGFQTYAFHTSQYRQRALLEFRPHVLVHIRDNWAFCPKYFDGAYSLMNDARRVGAKVLLHTPIDSSWYPEEFVDTVEGEGDLTTVTTQWGVDVLAKLGAPVSKMRVHSPGVDPEVYHPKPTGAEVRAKFGLPESTAPLFVHVGTNLTSRKNQAGLILAFRDYLDRYDGDAVLYIHSPPGYFNFPHLVSAVGLEGKQRVFVPSYLAAGVALWGRTPEDVADLYRSASALVNLSFAEGFDMPSAEAAACGTPVVVNDFPVHREVLGEFSGRTHVELVPSTQTVTLQSQFQWQSSPQDVADALDRAAHAPTGEGGVPPRLRWDYLGKQLSELCESLVTEDL